jgi:hypothetical protein
MNTHRLAHPYGLGIELALVRVFLLIRLPFLHKLSPRTYLVVLTLVDSDTNRGLALALALPISCFVRYFAGFLTAVFFVMIAQRNLVGRFACVLHVKHTSALLILGFLSIPLPCSHPYVSSTMNGSHVRRFLGL